VAAFQEHAYDGAQAVTTEEPTRRTGRRWRDPSNRPIELVIVDEHPVMRAGVRTLLENDADVSVVAEADSVDEAVGMCRDSSPDVVLLDVDRADAQMIDDMQRLRRELPNGALVVLGRHEDDEELYRAVVGGAAGHVGDTAGPAQLVETIKEAAHGAEPIQRTLAARPNVGRRVLEAYAELAQRAPDALDANLSERELRILELAAEGRTNYQIGREIGLSEHTVKGSFSALLTRLGLRHRTEAVVHALRLGWISAPPNHLSKEYPRAEGHTKRKRQGRP
jgi:DNA-binding NarL/FixJ family response regulator